MLGILAILAFMAPLLGAADGLLVALMQADSLQSANAGVFEGASHRGTDGVMCGDVWVLIGVGGDIFSVVQGFCVVAGTRG